MKRCVGDLARFALALVPLVAVGPAFAAGTAPVFQSLPDISIPADGSPNCATSPGTNGCAKVIIANDNSEASTTILVVSSVVNTNGTPVTQGNISITAVGDACSPSSGDSCQVFNVQVPINPGSVAGNAANISLLACDPDVASCTPGGGGKTIDSFILTVTAPTTDAMPDAINDSGAGFSTSEDTGFTTGSVLANDDLGDEPTTVTAVQNPSANGATVTIANASTGTINYTPASNFNGSDTFTYTITDNDGDMDTATVTVSVTAVNDPPTFMLGGNQTFDEGDPAQSLTDFITMISAGPANESGQTLTPSISNDNNGIFSAQPAIANFTPGDGTADITFTPSGNTAGGTANVTVTFTDNGGGTNATSMMFTITVNNVNQAPVAENDSASVAEDGQVDINVHANDTDQEDGTPTGNPIIATMPANGSASVVSGNIRYIPNANYFGSDSFTYRAVDSDGTQSSATATVTITVTSVNDVPTFNHAGNQVVDEDGNTHTLTNFMTNISVGPSNEVAQRASLSINASLSDPDNIINGGVTITKVLVSPGNDTGTLSFQTRNNNLGTATVTVTVNDGGSAPNSAQFMFTITTNDPPNGMNDSANTNENMAVVIDVLANDTDTEGNLDPSSVVVTSAPSNGSTMVNTSTGEITYTPNGGFSGTDTFDYEVDDIPYSTFDGDQAATATVTVNVNALPVANNDSDTTDEDNAVTIDVTANDTDSDGTIDDTTVVITTGPTNGMAVDQNDGTVLYTPNANFNGMDSFMYTVMDNDGATSNTATVTITINDINDPPVAVNDSAMTDSPNPVMITVLSNDTDIDGTIDPTTVAIGSAPSNGMTAVDPVTGVITYTPNAMFSGMDTFTYTVDDDDGDPSNAATVTVDVNASPVAMDDAANTNEQQLVMISVLANDTDSDGTLVASSVAVASAPSNGMAIANMDGTISYTPNAAFDGMDTFTYTVDDNDGATSNAATVTVTVNDSPVANNDSGMVDEDNSVGIDLDANDTDSDGTVDPDSIVISSAPSDGMAVPRNDGSGIVDYTPNANFNGSDSFMYTIMDDDGATSNAATVDVTINPINDPPVANNDGPVNVNSPNPVMIDVLANDTDVEMMLDPTSVTAGGTAPTKGMIAIDPVTGVITYTPSGAMNGIDTFTYTVADQDTAAADDPITSLEATVTVDINFSPVAVGDSSLTNRNTPVIIDVLANDTDADGTIDVTTVMVVTPPGVAGATAIPQANGTIVYTPATDDLTDDAFSYTVMDNDGATSNTVGVTVEVNDPPVANDDNMQMTDEDVTANLAVLANDTDSDGTLDVTTVMIVSMPSNGTATPQADGTVDYAPDANFFGSDSFTYTVDDDDVNDKPVAVADMAATDEGNPVVIDVVANDTDVDGTVDPTTVVVTSAPTNGTTMVNGTTGEITYTPNGGFFGMDTLMYTVDDDDGDSSDPGTVTINVNGRPVTVNDMFTVKEDSTGNSLDVLTNDTDDGTIDVTTVTIVVMPTNGTAVAQPDGTITYAPTPDFDGPADDTLTYTVDDDTGLTSLEATVTITVDPVPDAADDSAMTDEEVPVAISNVLANDEVDRMTATVGALINVDTSMTDGMVGNNGDGSFNYTPNIDFFGVDTFTYTIADVNGDTDTATVTITVNGLPEPVNDAFSFLNTEVLMGDVTADNFPQNMVDDSDDLGDTGPMMDQYTITQFGPDPGNAELFVLNADGTFTYDPLNTFDGMVSFQYTVTDMNGDVSAPATVNITVQPDLTPVAQNDAFIVDEGGTLMGDVTADNGNGVDDLGNGLGATGSIELVAMSGPTQAGMFTFNPDGTFSYTHNDTNTPLSDSFQYTITDGDGDVSNTGTVTLTINPFPDPVADNYRIDVDSTLNANDLDGSGTPTAGDNGLIANDDRGDGPATVSMVNGDAMNVGMAITTGQNGSLTVNANGTFVYTPDTGFMGTDTFTYTLDDTDMDTGGPATVTIVVDPFPSVVNDSYDVTEDVLFDSAVASVVDNDDTTPDFNPPMAVVPACGGGARVEIVSAPAGTLTMNCDGTFTYLTVTNTTATSDTFTYRLFDDQNDRSATDATVTLNIDRVPDGRPDDLSIEEDTFLFDNVLQNNGNGADDQGDGPATASLVGALRVCPDMDLCPGLPSPTKGDNQTDPGAFYDPGLLTPTGTLMANGDFLYQSSSNFNGFVAFSYQLTDSDAVDPDTSGITTVIIEVTRVNDPPVANNDPSVANDPNFITDQNTPIMFSVVDNDTDIDPDDNPTADKLVVNNFQFLVSGADGNNLTIIQDMGMNTGMVRFDPAGEQADLDDTEQRSVTFQYFARDTAGGISVPSSPLCSPTFPLAGCGLATVIVTGINDAPVAINTSYSVQEGMVLNASALQSSDVDVEPVTYTKLTDPANGVITNFSAAAGTFTYTPNPGFSGVDTFTFKVNDGTVDSNTATATITVANLDPPDAVNDSGVGFSTNEDMAFTTASVLTNDSVTNLQSITADSMSVNGGTVFNNNDGTFGFTPAANFAGTDSFTYTITDPSDSDTATVTIQVAAVNDPPNFMIDGNITHVATDFEMQTDPDYAGSFVYGPDGIEFGATGNEQALQSVLGFTVTVTDNGPGVLDLSAARAPKIDNAGQLTYWLKGVAGTATLTVTMQDTGDTLNGGNDTSAPQMFQIIVPDGLEVGVSKVGVCQTCNRPDAFLEGFSATYTITVHNNATLQANGVRVVDNLPAGMDVANATWTCTPATLGFGNCLASSGTGNVDVLVNVPPHRSILVFVTTSPLVGSGLKFVNNTVTLQNLGTEVNPDGAGTAFGPENNSATAFNVVGEVLLRDGFEDPMPAMKRSVRLDKAEGSPSTLALPDLDALDLEEFVPTPIGMAFDDTGHRVGEVQAWSIHGRIQVRVAVRGTDQNWRVSEWVDVDRADRVTVEFVRYDIKATNQLEASILESGRLLMSRDNR